MNDDILLSVTQELSGTTVRSRDRMPIAKVRDVAIEPVRGLTIGLVVSLPDGTYRLLPSPLWHIAGDVIAERGGMPGRARATKELAQCMHSVRDLLGLEVVTEGGTVVGSIRDVLISPVTREVAFSVGPPFDNMALAAGFVLHARATSGYAVHAGRVLVGVKVAREIALAFSGLRPCGEGLAREASACS